MDKQLEGRELDREVQQEQRKDDELPVVTEEVIDVELAHRGRVVDALQLILERRELTVSRVGLPQREARALEAVQAAVAGRDPTFGTFVYAEDRQRLLEQALAVLQQNIAIDARYGDLAERVGELRHELAQLEEAQDDLIDDRREPVIVKPPAEDDDTSLDGPERDIAKPASELDGPERIIEKPASSLKDEP